MVLTTCTGVITKVLPKTDKIIMGFNVHVLKPKTANTSTKPKQSSTNKAKNKK